MDRKNNQGKKNEILEIFGIKTDEVEAIPEKFLAGEMPNRITDADVVEIAQGYGNAICDRLKKAANIFNMCLFISDIDIPWRKLLEDFREDMECTSNIQLLTLPGGSEQPVVVDFGKFPGDQKLRQCLWELHELMEEIENYNASDYINRHVAKAFGQQGGSPAVHDDEKILEMIREVAQNNSSKKRLKGTEIVSQVTAELNRLRMPIPGKTKFYELLKRAEEDTS